MKTSSVYDFEKSARTRLHYLDEIKGHLSSYSPDSKGMIIRAMENPHSGINQCLHQLVANLYDQATNANLEKNEKRKEIWNKYKQVKIVVLDHINNKKNASKDLVALKTNNLWLSHTECSNYSKCFKASDHLADLLCLAKISVKEKLSEDVCRLSHSIQELLENDLNQYFQLIESDACTKTLEKKFRTDFLDLEKAFVNKQYDKALLHINNIDLLITVNFKR